MAPGVPAKVGFPEIFTKPPTQASVKKPGQLTEDQVKQYFEQVYHPYTSREYQYKKFMKGKNNNNQCGNDGSLITTGMGIILDPSLPLFLKRRCDLCEK